MNTSQQAPICLAEEAWANSQLSIARHYGGINFRNHEYLIVNQRGMDLWECTAEANRLGRDKAIPPGEPADLVRKDFIPLYRKLGRERFLEILKATAPCSDKEIKQRMKAAIADTKRTTVTPPQSSLFNEQ